MPNAYPDSLTTEHVKSHLQKLRVKSKASREHQIQQCDDELMHEYDVEGKYIGKDPLTDADYEKYAQRFAIATEMLTDPKRFSSQLLPELKQNKIAAGAAGAASAAGAAGAAFLITISLRNI